MISIYKPYRLINTKELDALQETFDSRLNLWNSEHALFPLSCHVTSNQIPRRPDIQCALLSKDSEPTVLIEQYDLNIIKQSLLGDNSPHFDSIAEQFFCVLINQLLVIHNTKLQKNTTAISCEEWFYQGSPLLKLDISLADMSMHLWINPQWVLTALPKPSLTKHATTNLYQALAEQTLQLHVELMPTVLTLSDIMNLQIGDVVKTEHQISAPLHLTHEKQILSRVHIGQNDSFKSVQLEETP